MSTIAITIISLCAIGIVSAVILYFVAQKFKVEEDPRIDIVEGLLPGANCGGCGCSGCSGFAAKLAEGGAELSACHVTSPEKKAEIAKLLGIELTDEEPTVAVVKCNGGQRNCADKFAYSGNPTCAANNSMFGGNKACPSACLGCGDCKAVCPENAIEVTGKLAQIDPDRCVSCGACISSTMSSTC